MSWKTTTIGEHCTVTSSKRFHLEDRSDSGVPFFCSKEIIQLVNGQEITDCDYIREDSYEQVKSHYGVPSAGDLLITTRGTYGIPYLYKSTDRFYFADGNLTWLKDFDNSLSAAFLYYWIRSYEGQKKIDAIAKGTAQKAVPISEIKNIVIKLPPMELQEQIADILTTYDSLIENNQRQIKLLEEAAQRLYKEWFVELRYPGHENVPVVDGVPEGWKQYVLKDMISFEIGGGWGEETITGKNEHEAYVIRGTDFEGLSNGNLQNIPLRYHTKSNLSSRTLEDGDILFEVSGGSRTEGVARTIRIIDSMLTRWNKPVICASFCKRIKPIDKEISQYLFDHFRYLRSEKITEEYDKRSASSIVNYRWKDFLEQRTLLYPPKVILKRYNDLAANIYKEIIQCSIIIETAKQSRDRLLPKLMSGEIAV